ncbi:MAG: serine/threonine protein kinase [Phycisphaerales bacterium]|nr:serine/threonine protein kinase [Phycisphaerales bacterium]
MDSQRYQRVRALFHAACELPVADRAAYLTAQCAGDLELHEEVRSLLEAAESAAGFLAEPVKGVAEILASPSLGLDGQTGDGLNGDRVEAGNRIGQYTIESVIARGGMGVVYKAVQESPHRYVALKVMRHGIASRQTLRRFHDEAEILARLSHPNIAQIFEAGTHLDRSMREGGEAIPFFAMEYIPEALTITDHAQRADLSSRQRLELFVKVSDAIHHGHQKGVIHRDLKPANILVDAAGEPKVIDFGVARSTNSDIAVTTQHTQVGQLVGTLQYMSPEQCDGDSTNIDSRSDVYSLGAVLYELLSGVPALDPRSSTIYQATIMVKEEEPRSLATLDKRFRGDLDAIATKALAKNRDHRYQSAEALKHDIERHLRGEPIEARPRSIWVKAAYRVGRHPAISSALAASSVAALVLACLFAIIWYGNQLPFEVEVSSDQRAAHLMTRFRRVLASFGGDTASPGSVFARLVENPMGGQAVIFSVREGEHATDGQLRVARPRTLDQPIWQTKRGEPKNFPSLPTMWNVMLNPSGFDVHRFLLADIFPETTGNEIVVVHESRNDSPNAICIYDFSGKLLYQSWHLGYIPQIFWWEEQGLLVCAGDRHGRPDVTRFGYPGGPWPRVIFAIRPRFGASTGWLNESGWPEEWRADSRQESTLAWYRTLYPPDLSSKFAPVKIATAFPRASEPPCISVTYESMEYGAFNLRIDPRGELVAVESTDGFFLASDRLPDVEPTLVDWPPPRQAN